MRPWTVKRSVKFLPCAGEFRLALRGLARSVGGDVENTPRVAFA